MKFAPALFPHVFHNCPACSTRLPERLTFFVPFLLCPDVPTFSPVFNGLTVFSTVTFGGAQSASCGLLCTSGRAIRCQTWWPSLFYHQIAPGAPGENHAPQHRRSSFPAGHYCRCIPKLHLFRRIHCAGAGTMRIPLSLRNEMTFHGNSEKSKRTRPKLFQSNSKIRAQVIATSDLT